MFGILRPCGHALGGELRATWRAHLCGLCLALRDEHGQRARVATNYDGLVISTLVDAQRPSSRRIAGPCPLRGMRRASVADGAGAQLAASVSLLLASAKLNDHVADGDGVFGHGVAGKAGGRVAARWATEATDSAAAVGFDTAVVTSAIDRQTAVERSLSHGDSVLVATEPTESATSAAFAHTAVLAEAHGNTAVLAEAGRLFGRIAHLLDAVEDRHDDAVTGTWNPLTVTGTSLDDARKLCEEAAHGIRLAIDDAQFADGALVDALLVHELPRAVKRAFAEAEREEVEPDNEAEETAQPRRRKGLVGLFAGLGAGGCGAATWSVCKPDSDSLRCDCGNCCSGACECDDEWNNCCTTCCEGSCDCTGCDCGC